jgi:ORF6N domain
MLQLSLDEWQANRSQIVTGSQKHREGKSLPYAFTEQGVAMLSGILNSPKAIQVNRTFVAMRRYAATYSEIEPLFIWMLLNIFQRMSGILYNLHRNKWPIF